MDGQRTHEAGEEERKVFSSLPVVESEQLLLPAQLLHRGFRGLADAIFANVNPMDHLPSFHGCSLDRQGVDHLQLLDAEDGLNHRTVYLLGSVTKFDGCPHSCSDSAVGMARRQLLLYMLDDHLRNVMVLPTPWLHGRGMTMIGVLLWACD